MPVPITAVSAGRCLRACQGRRISPFPPNVRGVIRQGKIIADSRVRDADFYSMSGLQFVTAIVCIFARTARAGSLRLSWAQRGGWGRFFSALLPPLGGIIRRRIVISGGGGASVGDGALSCRYCNLTGEAGGEGSSVLSRRTVRPYKIFAVDDFIDSKRR